MVDRLRRCQRVTNVEWPGYLIRGDQCQAQEDEYFTLML